MMNPHDWPAWVRWPARTFSPIYGAAMSFRNAMYDRSWKRTIHVGVPVISVGNLSVGGTGKTPCVEWVARQCSEAGYSVCLISRGYKSGSGGFNDEAMVLEDNLPDVPHLQNPDRVGSAEIAITELEANCLILDDGLQHRRLHRHFDIVLIDTTCPPQRDWLLPGGTLREHAGEGLRRADAVILTRCDQANDVAVTRKWIEGFVRPGTPIAESTHAPIAPPPWNSTPVAMVCGIGNPAAFRQTLITIGGHIIAERRFPDHHRYTRSDVESLSVWASQLPPDTNIAITQKDHVKLRLTHLSGHLVTPIRIGLSFRNGEAELVSRMLAAVESVS